MRTTRRTRILAVILSLCALLFAQAVLAGYPCSGPSQEPAAASMPADMPCDQAMPSADQQLGLCHAHCQTDQQKADHYEPPVLVALEQFAPGLSVPLAVPQLQHPSSPTLKRSSGPPIAIEHCCFRI